MNKPIESIWKEGFLKNDALIAPKVNDLYNQKSRMVIDHFKRIAKRNLYGIVMGAVILLLATIYAQIPLIGLAISTILCYLVWVGWQQAKALKKINQGASSYQYIKAFDNWLRKTLNLYAKIYHFAYPLLFLFIALGTVMTHPPYKEQSILEKILSDPGTLFVGDLPILWILGLVVLIILTAVFSQSLYRFDVLSIYGRVFKKIEILLSDMEELRGNP